MSTPAEELEKASRSRVLRLKASPSLILLTDFSRIEKILRIESQFDVL